jgi:myo-inositol-1(or 4)-monophosphatase
MNAELRDLAATIAREAGDMVAAGRRNSSLLTGTKSSPTDMVTQFDRESELLIVERLREHRPDDAVIGEEGTDSGGTSGVWWLVDPIDGTTNFLYDLPGYAVSIAAVDAEGTIAGAVYVPSSGELFSAARGLGALLGDRPIHCSPAVELSHALVATGFSYQPERRGSQAERVSRLIPFVRDIRRFGAAAVDLCHVACGRVDAYFEEYLGPWDLAAGELIAREAGCRTGDFSGHPVRPEQVLACSSDLFESLAELIREASTPT